ncbi:MAG: hypothetical protein GX259_01145 [Bacteroidales bacterium]|nr:hypothetical protein [Bacteroidales bacterium]
MKKYIFFSVAIVIAFMFSSCELLQEEPPTKTKMEGVWKVSKITDMSTGADITSRVNFPITAFHLSSDGTIISTAGPLMMYVVYGNNKYTQIAGKVDQVFNYAGLDFNGGEFFIGGGVETRFTLEMKLEGLPGQKALTTLLEIIGIGNDYLDVVIYHKFINVKINFSENYETMFWEIDEQTTAQYNTKDKYGNYVLWQGWPVNSFSKVQIRLEKQVKDLRELVEEAVK